MFTVFAVYMLYIRCIFAYNTLILFTVAAVAVLAAFAVNANDFDNGFQGAEESLLAP